MRPLAVGEDHADEQRRCSLYKNGVLEVKNAKGEPRHTFREKDMYAHTLYVTGVVKRFYRKYSILFDGPAEANDVGAVGHMIDLAFG